MVKMRITGALLLMSSWVIGCSSGDDGEAGTERTTDAGLTTDQPPPCPTAPASGDRSLPDSPVAKCVGYFTTTGFGTAWLHRTGAGCMWGTDLILAEDGSAVELEGSKRTGHWEGDEYHFTVRLGASTYGFNRALGDPSK